MIRAILVVVGFCALAAACETMSPEQCQVADWRALGQIDGAGGEGLGKFTARQDSCAKAGVQADFDAYSAGREQGLTYYCQPQAGFRTGLSGAAYQGVCPANLEAGFLEGFQDGSAAYSVQRAFNDANSRISSLHSDEERIEDKIEAFEDELLRKDISDEQRRNARDRLRELRDERDRLRRDLRDAEYDLRYREDDLYRAKADIGLRWGAW